MLSERMTVKEVAALFRVSQHTVRRWIREGLLDVERAGAKGKRIYIIPDGRYIIKRKRKGVEE
jgi:excisionase family DNA binding protein